MKFKAILAFAGLSLSALSFGQTKLYVQDLNYIPKHKDFFYQGNLQSSNTTTEREVYRIGSLQNFDIVDKERSMQHILGYGLTNQLTVFFETSYTFSNKSEYKDAEENGVGFSIPGKTNDKGLGHIAAGMNWRFLEQNIDKVNGDLRISYTTALQKATRGTFYDSNNDGNLDKTSDGNSALISPEFNISLAGGKKFEQFEIRGLLGLQMATQGDYKTIKGNSDLSDLKNTMDGYAGFIYQLSGQLKLNENIFLYANIIQTVVSSIKVKSTEANGTKNQSEQKALANFGLDLGAKVAVVPNKYFVYAELHGDASPEHKITSKENGVNPYIRNNVKSATTGRFTLGFLASF